LVNDDGALPGASIAAAAIALAGACATGFLFLDRVDAVLGTVLAAATLCIAVVDLARFEIPDVATLAIFISGLVWNQIWRLDVEALAEPMLRTAIVAGSLFAVRAVYRKVRGVEGLGLGDVKLAGAAAVWLSWPHIVAALLIAVGAAILVIVSRSVLAKEKIQAHAAIPFGTFLAPAIWLAWFAQVSNP
jgi:leader peptidase (prepilin peptidase) / N-methyltransferase